MYPQLSGRIGQNVPPEELMGLYLAALSFPTQTCLILRVVSECERGSQTKQCRLNFTT